MILPDNCTVRLTDRLPLTVGGFIAASPDGHKNIYINARLNRIRQRGSLRHELTHDKRDDLHNGLPIREVEGHAQPAPGLMGIPGLKRACDLLPAPAPLTPPPRERSDPPSPYQLRALAEALAALDLSYNKTDMIYWW